MGNRASLGWPIYAHYVDDLFAKQPHVRSAEVEEVLGMLARPLRQRGSALRMLTGADVQFAPAPFQRRRRAAA